MGKPWKIPYTLKHDGYANYRIMNRDGQQCVAHLTDVDKDTADFIIKAVNCHDDLVEVLSRILQQIGNEGNIDHVRDEGMIEDAKQALAKATS